jgi:hypothetical protein
MSYLQKCIAFVLALNLACYIDEAKIIVVAK